jgi:Fic family protein
MPFNSAVPYNDLPRLPPTFDVETKAILKKCLSATRALAELKGAGDFLPDQAILMNAILLQEAKLSSEIENIISTQDDLFEATLNEAQVTDPNILKILRYRNALRCGFDSLVDNPLSLNLIRQVHSILVGIEADFRKSGEQIAIRNSQTKEIRYTPPAGGAALMEKLQNLEQFLVQSDGFDPLIKMAVAHCQFGAILPFLNENGRTSRILNVLYLLSAKLLKTPILHLSHYIIHTKSDYHSLLRKVTENGEWEPWILYTLQGVEETARWTTERIMEIKKLFDETITLCKERIPEIYSKELMELIFRQPYCKIGFLRDFGIAKRQSASKYLKKLEEIGILKGKKQGREMVFKHPALIKILTE